MTQYTIEEIKNSALTYMKTQNNPVTYETVARKLGIQRKVMRYVCSKRHVYTL